MTRYRSEIDPYRQVDCSFYSKLELLALRRRTVSIHISLDGHVEEKITRIKTLRTSNKEEYLITSDGDEIRLDHIRSVNPVVL